MPKRKLGDADGSSKKRLSIHALRLTTKFEESVITFSRGLKTARGFERQKLGRREKTAKEKNDAQGIERLHAEINVLKNLDPQVTSQKYLFKQLSKTKRIAEAPAFIEFKESTNIPTEGPRDTAEANVLARLYKSTPVKNILSELMKDVKRILKIEDGPAGKKDKSEKEGSQAKNAKTESKPKADKREPSISEEEGEGPEGDVEMEDAESIDFAQFDSRLASGSEDEDGEGDEQSDNEFPQNNHNSDFSISRSPTPESDFPPPKKSKSTKKASTAPATSTTFLPSLTMGGYFSGSESEPEDLEEQPKRKNRMGQQARRALWEKKYGSGANHVKNPSAKDKRNRDSGWDARRGATGGGDYGRRGGKMGQRQDRPQRGGPPAPRKPDDKGPLHPSWEAAKKAKEQKTAEFAGKKVVFD